MNLSALPELLLAWVKNQGNALLQGGKAEQASPFKVGADYAGRVLDQLPNGRHLVQLAGQKLDMGLPRNAQIGDTVRLTFLNAGPRPTFLLSQEPLAPAQQVRISQTAQQVNALMRIAQPAPQGPIQPGAQVASQGMGQVAGMLAAKPLPAALSPTPATPTTTPTAVAPQAGAPASPDSAALQSAKATQSIQALAVAQSTTSAQATARPIVANVVILQGQITASANTSTPLASANTTLHGQAVDGLRSALATSTTAKPTVLADTAAPSPHILPNRLAQTVRESGLFYEAHLARWSKGGYSFEALLNEPQARLGRAATATPGLAELGGMPEEAARIAGRQLHMLEGGPFLWQGLVWPGQWLEWQVEERRDGQGGGLQGEEANPWSTELRLTLPRMGALHALISLRGTDVSLRLQAADPAAAQTLRQALPELQRGLESGGLHALSLTVSEGTA